MIMPDFGDTTRVQPYKSYKAEQFNKKFAKARNLLNSIDETSLRPEDKKRLKENIKELFQ
jgi:hypothetical protein